jgi:proline iminopeptidase
MGERIEHVTADDGCVLWTVRSGGEPVGSAGAGHGFVFCHGGPGFWDTLGPIARMIEDLGPVVRWDQRGGGRSQWLGPYTVARFLADLDQVRRHHGLDRVTLLGHSFGAMLALQYALDPRYGARVRKLVYVAGIGLGWAWQDEHRARARLAAEPYAVRTEALRAIPERTDDPDRALELAATQVVEVFGDDGVYAPVNAEMRAWSEQDLIGRCRGLDVPTLIVDGARDVRPRWSVDSLAEAVPHCTRVEFAASGHFPWLDEPAAFEALLRGFVME